MMTVDQVVSGASVLLNFRAENVRSFLDEFELSMLATGMAEQGYVRRVAWREGGSPIGVLPVAAIFGANGSGKSNALRAMNDMRHFVLHSFRGGDPTGGIPRRPFVLAGEGRTSPSRFEIGIVLDGVRHDYGFTVDDHMVLEEWCFRYPKGRAALVFRRELDEVQFGSTVRSRSGALVDLLRPNALLVSTAAATAYPVLLPLYKWFTRNLVLAEFESRSHRQAFTAELLDDDRYRENVLALLRAADLGVVDAKRHELDPVLAERVRRAGRIIRGREDDDGDDGLTVEQLGVRLVHRGDGIEVEFEAPEESMGTRVWFGLIGPITKALAEGSVFLADELDASLHPALVSQLVRLFQDPEANPNRAQLIFNSHDASLLPDSTGNVLLGRDQIWFTEKYETGNTVLYPLVDLSPRKSEAINKRYLEGRYGGTPIISHDEFTTAASMITSQDR